MHFFNFHHHDPAVSYGIYNSDLASVPEIFFSTGINPMHISEGWEKDFQKVINFSGNIHCIAIGECGLDSRFGNEKTQREVFTKHLELAAALEKPVIIHCVRKFQEIISLSKEFGKAKIIHGFNKDEKTAELLLENDFSLSFGTALLHNLSLQHTFRNTRIENIFLETDDAQVDISTIYETAATLKNMNLEELTSVIMENINRIRLFR